jgi:hypothetical protein
LDARKQAELVKPQGERALRDRQGILIRRAIGYFHNSPFAIVATI